jgi:hypothetical protein
MEKKLSDYLHYYLYGKIWEAGVSTCTLIGIGDSYYTIKTKQGTLLTLSNRANIKLVLRRLEDITDEEKKEQAIGSCWDFSCYRTDQFHSLLKQGFDLFGLIDAGLAVDAKKITP